METTRSKKKPVLVLVIILAAIAVAAIAIFGVSKATAPQRYAKACELGNRYLDEENYETALIEFDKAIKIEPRKFDAYEGKMKAYDGKKDVESVIETFETAQSNVAFETITSSGKNIAVTSYETLSKTKIAEGDYAGAIEALRKAEALGTDESSNIKVAVTEGALNASPDGNLEDALKWLEANGAKDTERYSVLSMVVDELKALAGVAATDDEKGTGIVEALRQGGILQNIQQANVGDKPLKTIDGNGMMSAFYQINGRVFYYYGGQEKGERSGQGTWIMLLPDVQISYLASGTWSKDIPNGVFTERRVDPMLERIWAGNIINGLWDGTVDIIDRHLDPNAAPMGDPEKHLSAVAHNGVFEVVETENVSDMPGGLFIGIAKLDDDSGHYVTGVYQNEANGIAGFDKN